MRTPGGRAALVVVGVVAVVAAGGCGGPTSAERAGGSESSAVTDAPTEPSEPTAPAEPAASTEPTPPPVDITGPLVIPESDPAMWPPGNLATLTPEALDATVAGWGADAGCSPYSLMIDYEAGLLSPEAYTAYAMYAMAPSLLATTVNPADLPLPERYSLCVDAESLQVDVVALQDLGFFAWAFLDYIDPAFRDQLWLRIEGQTYEDAT